MVKDPCDSRRKNEFITSRCIPINIYEGKNEVIGKINKESFKNECHYYVKEPQTFCKALARGVLTVILR